MATKSKKTGQRLAKAAKQRKRERFLQMTPRERRRLKRDRREMNKMKSETSEEKFSRQANEIMIALCFFIVIIVAFAFGIISFIDWIVSRG